MTSVTAWLARAFAPRPEPTPLPEVAAAKAELDATRARLDRAVERVDWLASFLADSPPILPPPEPHEAQK